VPRRKQERKAWRAKGKTGATKAAVWEMRRWQGGGNNLVNSSEKARRGDKVKCGVNICMAGKGPQ